MSKKNYLKYANKKIIIIGVALILLLLAIHTVEKIAYIKNQNSLQYYGREATLAKAYNSDIRQDLFKLVVEEENYQYASALGSELHRSVLDMSARALARSSDMSREWKDWFINDIDNLSNMLSNRHYVLLNNDFFCFFNDKRTPTDAEKEIMSEIRNIWIIADEYSDRKLLSKVSYSKEHSKDGTFYTKVIAGEVPSADYLAEHLFILAKKFAKVPRTALHFVYDVDEFTSFTLFDFTTNNNITVEDKKIGADLVNFLRGYKYEKILDKDIENQEIIYKIQYNQKKRLRTIEIYNGYIRVDGSFGNYYVYPPIQWKNIEDRYGNTKTEDWRYLGEEFGSFPSIKGCYKVDEKFVDKIKSFVVIHNLFESYN